MIHAVLIIRNISEVMQYIMNDAQGDLHECIDFAARPDLTLLEICQLIKQTIHSDSRIEDTGFSPPEPEIIQSADIDASLPLRMNTRDIIVNWCQSRLAVNSL